MPMIIDDSIVAIFFLGAAPVPGVDWMMSVNEVQPNKAYKLVWRFRYYNTADPFDTKDKKNWYEGEVSATRAKALAGAQTVAHEIRNLSSKPELYHAIVRGESETVKSFLDRFTKLPFVHSRPLTGYGIA